ncbi:MAG: dienelactone hydrolase family protein, partial [Candidatus Omnitrophica bacterium]|nr:dienelactone hydrolase family protein [Candidatus Omnitrophota bacterium]
RDASEWVAGLYGGRFIGDELAQQGYVVFAMDALYWGSRGSREEDSYARQQALASNLFQLGMSWAGTIVQQDLRSVEFVRSLAQVDPERIGAVGLSMGANRVFHLLAATDHVQVGAAICWMTTTRGVLQPGNNQTLGQSAFSMLHPGLRSRLDYPHVAAATCPRPMLFYCGEQDALFPADSVKEAFQYLRGVWDHAGAGESLITQCWPTGHVFSVEMQDKVFEFMGRHLKNRD